MQIFGSNELVNDVLMRDLCIGCGMCVDICPYFRNYKGKTAMLFPCTLEQGRCNAHCPKTDVDLDALSHYYWEKPYDGSPLGNFTRILAARAGDAVSGQFQGGGTVTALVTYALTHKIADGAVLTGAEGIAPVARFVTEPKEVAGQAGSKFIAAPTLSALNRAIQKGAQKIAVVGTPCQMTALAQMRMNPLEQEDFTDPIALTIGLFCNWALDHRTLTAYLSERMNVSDITGMDIPPPPAEVLTVKTKEGEKRFPLKEVRHLIPNSCFICPDMTAEWSDVSVGMYEGRPGWNTLLVRTAAGAKIVDRAVTDGWLVTESFPDENEAALAKAALAKKERALQNAERKGLLDWSADGSRPSLRVPPDVMERILGRDAG